MEDKYYYIEDGKQKGPVSIAELITLIDRETYIWTTGMSDWKAAKEVPEVAEQMLPPTPQNTNEQQSPNINLCPPTYLVWSIITTILCCWPLGIASIIYAAKVERTFLSGQVELAQSYSRKAKNWMIANVICAFVFVIIYGIILALVGTIGYLDGLSGL